MAIRLRNPQGIKRVALLVVLAASAGCAVPQRTPPPTASPTPSLVTSPTSSQSDDARGSVATSDPQSIVTPPPDTLSPEDVGRMLVVDVTPIDEANVEPAVIDAERALQVAQANWGREGTPEPFLVVMTDQSSIGSVDPIEGRPVWVVRYSDFTDMSPGGVELHWGYVIVDATSGEFIKSFLSK